MITTIITIVTVVVGLLAGSLFHRQQSRHELEVANQKATALQQAAHQDAVKQAEKYLAEAKTEIQSDRRATELELADQQTDIESRQRRVERRLRPCVPGLDRRGVCALACGSRLALVSLSAAYVLRLWVI